VDLQGLPPRSIAVVLGTRPELVKLAGVIDLLGAAARVIHTGQHYSATMSDAFFADLDLPAPAVRLEIGGQTRGAQIGAAVTALDGHFAADAPRAVVVQGDTNTVLAGAVAANAREIPLVHVEAGLRSHDRAMPEEHNRVVTDHLADLCLAPTDVAAANLRAEGIPDDRIVVTGNTVVEAVQRVLPAADVRAAVRSSLGGLAEGGYVLATFHRPENVDDPANLETILGELIALPLPTVLPVHPRTEARISGFGLHHLLDDLIIIPPASYRQFLALAADCALLVSDSGGVQEEASVLKRPVVVVRNSTERPEVLGTFAELVKPGPDIGSVAGRWLEDLPATHAWLAGIASPYGDGSASRRSIEALGHLVGSR
jgi:UDP-N-acetylglucosamine 2-epimerase (non-hydrolysing)